MSPFDQVVFQINTSYRIQKSKLDSNWFHVQKAGQTYRELDAFTDSTNGHIYIYFTLRFAINFLYF